MEETKSNDGGKQPATESEAPKSRRGFASMTPEQRRMLGSRGGKTAHERGTAHKWTTEQAREAGRKGGTAARRTRRSTVAEQTEPEPTEE